jgi:GNAT superfamily N-acetyltransferase
LNGEKGTEVQLLVATADDDPEQVTGFLLYLPVQGDWEACSVAYMAVREGHRRQGVARAMIAEMVARFPHVELACTVGKVPYFEALGFAVIGQRETQVLMSTRHYRSNGLRGFIDTTPIYRSLEVQQIHTYLLQKNGKRAMLDAEKQRDRHLDQTTRHTEEFVRQRLTVH